MVCGTGDDRKELSLRGGMPVGKNMILKAGVTGNKDTRTACDTRTAVLRPFLTNRKKNTIRDFLACQKITTRDISVLTKKGEKRHVS